jgi:hypothetical protein
VRDILSLSGLSGVIVLRDNPSGVSRRGRRSRGAGEADRLDRAGDNGIVLGEISSEYFLEWSAAGGGLLLLFEDFRGIGGLKLDGITGEPGLTFRPEGDGEAVRTDNLAGLCLADVGRGAVGRGAVGGGAIGFGVCFGPTDSFASFSLDAAST